MSPDSPFPELRDENRLARLETQDYYYDLSSSGTSHLERSFWYEPTGQNLTVGEALPGDGRLASPEFWAAFRYSGRWREVNRAARAVLLPHRSTGAPPPWCSIYRHCGNFPTPFPPWTSADIRRSDMVWSLLNHYAGIARGASGPTSCPARSGAPLPTERPAKGSFATMEQDLLGHAFYSSLRDLLEYRAAERQTSRGMPKGSRYPGIHRRRSRHVRRILSRIPCGEAFLIRSQLHQDHGTDLCVEVILPGTGAWRPGCPWWLGKAEFAGTLGDLRSFVADLESIYTDERLDEFKRRDYTASIPLRH